MSGSRSAAWRIYIEGVIDCAATRCTESDDDTVKDDDGDDAADEEDDEAAAAAAEVNR